jgi:hypothetical protein
MHARAWISCLALEDGANGSRGLRWHSSRPTPPHGGSRSRAGQRRLLVPLGRLGEGGLGGRQTGDRDAER